MFDIYYKTSQPYISTTQPVTLMFDIYYKTSQPYV
jgi:hypothetical protein